MELYVKKIEFNKENNFTNTITYEKGEILDIRYLSRGLNFKNQKSLLNFLDKNNIQYEVINDVLLFSSLRVAKLACETINKKHKI